ncbi:MAG TPA: hypothetical protein VGJ00_08750 [Rhabdochlamydiaceae bacterium]|jgi:hypothetical protein
MAKILLTQQSAASALFKFPLNAVLKDPLALKMLVKLSQCAVVEKAMKQLRDDLSRHNEASMRQFLCRLQKSEVYNRIFWSRVT